MTPKEIKTYAMKPYYYLYKKVSLFEAYRLGFDELPSWLEKRLPEKISYLEPVEFGYNGQVLKANRGDYTVRDGYGKLEICPKDLFRLRFQPAEIAKNQGE